MRYREKPRHVDAICWTGMDGVFEIVEEWVSPHPVDRHANDVLAIHTLNGTVTAAIGDWIIREQDGNMKIHRGEKFFDAYEPVEEEVEA